MHLLEEAALAGALAFGAYELYHLHKYGNFGIGNPNHHGITFGGQTGYGGPTTGFGGPTGYGDPMTGFGGQTGYGGPTTGFGGSTGYGNSTHGHHHGHHHHHMF
jgi:hypothetical protein